MNKINLQITNKIRAKQLILTTFEFILYIVMIIICSVLAFALIYSGFWVFDFSMSFLWKVEINTLDQLISVLVILKQLIITGEIIKYIVVGIILLIPLAFILLFFGFLVAIASSEFERIILVIASAFYIYLYFSLVVVPLVGKI